VIVTFIAMLVVSWRRWTSMIVDIGRETDLPFRIMNGEMLYRDVHYIYPPFSPYFNALLYRVFGPHLDTLILGGIFFAALLTFLCYKIASRFMPSTQAAIAVSFIVVLCVFKPAGNMILSYSAAGVHAAVFSLAAILFTMDYAERGKRRDLIVAGVFIGLAAITKQEFAFSCATAATAFLIYRHRSNVLAFLRDLAFVAIPAMIVAVPVFAWLFANIDWRILINDCHLFLTNIPESLVFYNRFRSGLDHPVASVFQMLGGAAVSIAFAALVVLFSDKTGRLRSRSVIAFAVSSIVVAIILFFFIEDWDGSPLRALPFFLAAMIFWSWTRKPKSGESENLPSEGSHRHQILFIIAVYALAMIVRVVLRVPSGGFSGSFYLPASIILIFYALLVLLPQAIGKWTNDDESQLRAMRIVTAICTLAIVVTGVSFGIRFRRNYNYEIVAPRGRLYGERYSGPALSETLKFIEANIAEGEFIAVLPEGCDIGFLTGRRMNFRHQVLIPSFLSEQDELDAIAALKKENIRYIFIPNRAMREFGKVEFGRDFYQTLGRYIEENYHVETIFGLTGDQKAVVGQPPFFVKVYKRNE